MIHNTECLTSAYKGLVENALQDREYQNMEEMTLEAFINNVWGVTMGDCVTTWLEDGTEACLCPTEDTHNLLVREYKFSDDLSYHRNLSCVNHPELRWSSKNPFMRTVFYLGEFGTKCGCTFRDMTVVRVENGQEVNSDGTALDNGPTGTGE